jgi:hypothetical protein
MDEYINEKMSQGLRKPTGTHGAIIVVTVS